MQTFKLAIWLVGLVFLCIYFPPLGFALIGTLLTLVIFALISVFFKDTFAHDPNGEKWYAFMVKVPLHHTVIIQKGGRPTHVLRGGPIPKKDKHLEDEPAVDDDDLADGYDRKDPYQNGNGLPVKSNALFGLWMLYKSFIMNVTGYHVFFPFFYAPSTYALPRYIVREEDGKKIFTVYEDRSNHIRNEIFTWYFEYTGAEIEKVPFTIKGSAQVRIQRFKEGAALFKTDSWNVLLDQALNSVVRGLVRKKLALRDVIGGVDDELWDTKKEDRPDVYREVAQDILNELLGYAIGAEDKDGDGTVDADSRQVKLIDLGINIERIDIIDFEDELSPDERKLIRAAVLAKEEAKGDVLKGRAEAINTERVGGSEAKIITKKGTAIARAQAKLLAAYESHPELGAKLAQADALRAFAENGGDGLLNAAIAAFISSKGK